MTFYTNLVLNLCDAIYTIEGGIKLLDLFESNDV
jgi:hypothetical protein